MKWLVRWVCGLLWVTIHCDNKKEYLITANSVGDISMMLAFVQAYQKNTKKNVIILCTKNREDFLLDCLEQTSIRTRVVSSHLYESIMFFTRTDTGRIYVRKKEW